MDVFFSVLSFKAGKKTKVIILAITKYCRRFGHDGMPGFSSLSKKPCASSFPRVPPATPPSRMAPQYPSVPARRGVGRTR